MRIHFIAIGGAAMHSLAISLAQAGHIVSGSDDEIFDPAKTRLTDAGLLPENTGWFPEKITRDISCVILGMHAHVDNPELQKAMELGLRVSSYPEFLYDQTVHKTRVVIAGSHGKTTITSMVMHVMKHCGYRFDYMVGSRIDGFSNMVSLSDDTDIAVFEGDEYLSSCLDPRPKFHVYKPQIALVSGIAWDHINVFPTWEEYIRQFRVFIDSIPHDGCLVYCDEDRELKALVTSGKSARAIPYSTPEYEAKKGIVTIRNGGNAYDLQIFGRHNMQNLEGARLICNQLGIDNASFFSAIVLFGGAGKRLQLLGKNEHTAVYIDFAHSPSKVKATVNAVKEQFPEIQLIACLELHTYSSLNKDFLKHYNHTMDKADRAIVYFSPETVTHKRLEKITGDDIVNAFGRNDLTVFTSKAELEHFFSEYDPNQTVLLLMSSGNFSGIDFQTLTGEILKR